MGLSLRVYFFEDGLLTRIPRAKIDRFFDGDSEERLPEYAGKKMRCAMVVLDMEQRQPVRIRYIDSMIVPFDAEGRLDFEERDRAGSLVVNGLDFSLGLDKHDNVIDLLPRLSQRKYVDEFKWSPTGEEIDLIVKDIFGQ